MPDILLLLVIILIAVVIWRGPKTLPQLGRAFGQGVKEARKEIDGMKDDMAAEKPAGEDDTGTTPPA